MDFKLTAQYGPGFSDWKPWKLTVTADGKVTQDTYTFPKGKQTIEQKSFALTKEEVQQLITKVRDSNFHKLGNDYWYNVTDNPTLIIRVTMNGKSNEVAVYAPDHQKDKDEVKRFLTVWNEVLKKVPPPNPDQRPE